VLFPQKENLQMRHLSATHTAVACAVLLSTVFHLGCTRLPLFSGKAIPLNLDGGGLTGRRIVVQCISPPDSYQAFKPGPALSRRISAELNIEGATVVIDNSNRLRDEDQPGAALLEHHRADRAILVEFEDFRIHDESDSYRGRTAYTLQVFKASKPSEAVLEQRIAGYTYPEDGPVDARTTKQTTFRGDFLADLAVQIARTVR